VGDDLGFLSRLVIERATKLTAALPQDEGRGATLAVVGAAVCESITDEANRLGSLSGVPENIAVVHARTLLRSKQRLDLLHQVVATYGPDVGRSDLPVGLMYLVDELIQDLLPMGADPLLHLGQGYMYSTLALLEAVPSLMAPSQLPHPHPVAFHLPGLSPENAMLAPILAHEVGHTSWKQGVRRDLFQAMDMPAIDAELRAAAQAGADLARLVESFEFWLQELMCDALAAVLAGPSFLFASAVFLPAPGESQLGGHPYPRDRVGFTLRILDSHGWTPTLSGLVPDVLAWCTDLANNPQLSGDPEETGLRAAIAVAEPAMVMVANQVAANRVTVEQFARCQRDFFDHLDLAVPPVLSDGHPASAWLIVLAGWLHELVQRGSTATEAMPEIAGDVRLNRFLLKTIELSGVTKIWGAP
jgi:hypothetical protein